ncbi:phage portal protein [Entomobacter blattae]|uniref:Phage portal protein, lambda family n=1 Tax=Entomobacter blattae TaxID=2762277 RepID=A0A7H1NUH2_9PROT|nr:phage portal protein [Entomobacter blattae]QNT79432.1 Phage portal protein, lambda family [Entomobacter blattae]
MKKSQLLGPDGNPLPLSAKQRTSALNSHWNGSAYDAADYGGTHMHGWNPLLWSPDVEKNPFRDRIVARVRDLVRNDGWASGVVTRILDNAIGGTFRPISKPDYRALKHKTGFSFDAEWADEFGRAIDSHWRSWAEDDGRYCDSERRLTFSQIMWVAMRHELIDGDALAILPWLPERVGAGKAQYATTIQLVDPDRLSDPNNTFDQKYIRGGVHIDEWGAPLGYYIRKAHQGDWFSADETVIWDYYERETDWGRPKVVHHFQPMRASEHKGAIGIFTPVLQRLKMLIKYDSTELDSAIVNAIFAAFLESPFDPVSTADALGLDDVDGNIAQYQENRREFHGEKKLTMGGVRIPTLFPGEKINTITAVRPASNFKDFENAVLRNVASGAGVSAQQVSNDWSDVNYSSARAAMLEAWKTMQRRRLSFAQGFASPIRTAWLEECCHTEKLPLPQGVNADWLKENFAQLKTPLCRCRWLGPGRGWIDPVSERQGAVLGMDAGLSTLENEVAENAGEDWEEVVDQRAVEVRRFDQLGLQRPDWAGKEQTATQASTPPQKPSAK